jgi:hypothetical protein
MTRHKLILDDDYEFLSFGLSCNIKDFRVAWHLNQSLGFNLKRDYLNVSDRENTIHEYSLYKHMDEENHVKYLLINNQSDGIPLVKAYKSFNLLLLVEGNIQSFDSDEFIQKLQLIEPIQFAMELDPKAIAKHQFLLFED